jgi:hypothetical protein
MKDPAECVIHGQGQVGVGTEADEEKLVDLARWRRARERRRRLDGPARRSAHDDAPLSRAEMREYVRALRERHGLKRIDPRTIVADAAFRLRRW